MVPAETPVTTPVAPSTVAIAALPLLHTPPAEASASVVVKPTQTRVVPVIVPAAGVV